MTDFSAARNYSTFGVRQSIRQLLHELREYADEELFTIDAIYVWKKPS